MSKWPGKTREVSARVVVGLVILAGLLMIVLSVVQGGVI